MPPSFKSHRPLAGLDSGWNERSHVCGRKLRITITPPVTNESVRRVAVIFFSHTLGHSFLLQEPSARRPFLLEHVDASLHPGPYRGHSAGAHHHIPLPSNTVRPRSLCSVACDSFGFSDPCTRPKSLPLWKDKVDRIPKSADRPSGVHAPGQ